MSGMFDSPLLRATHLSLQANWKTHLETVNNLNHYDTPHYKARHTDFRAALQGVEADHPRGPAFQAYLEAVSPREEMNIDRELAQLSECSLQTDALTRILNRHYQGLRQAIYEGKR